MSVSAVSAQAAPQRQQGASIASNFDAFLKLLTTQLANQDPLSPMDSNQFTQQLVQFASVEQSVATNTKLDDILGLLNTTRLSAGAEYLGQEVVADGRSMVLGKSGATSFTMTTDEKAAFIEARVYDSKNRQIATLQPEPKAGEQSVVWNGRGDDGYRAPAGTYRVEVDALGLNGAPMNVKTGFVGTVSSVESNGEMLFLQVGDRRVAIDDIEAVRAPAASEDEGVSS